MILEKQSLSNQDTELTVITESPGDEVVRENWYVAEGSLEREHC